MYALNIPIFIEEKQNQKTNRIQNLLAMDAGLLHNQAKKNITFIILLL